MKRSVFALALSMGIFTMHAQNDRTALEGTRPGDNWSIELKTGAVTPLTHSAFFKMSVRLSESGSENNLLPFSVWAFKAWGM